MSSRNARDFEFTLGKLGLTLFISGFASLLLLSFMGGMIVGKNIDTYPEKIAKGVPKAIKENVIEPSGKAISRVFNHNTPPAAPSPQEEKSSQPPKDDLKLTFYDTLTKKGEDTGHTAEIKGTTQKAAPRPDGTVTHDKYIIQIASFRERTRVDTLHKKVCSLGYKPTIDTIALATRGTWYRLRLYDIGAYDDARHIAKILEKKIRGLKCMVVKDKR